MENTYGTDDNDHKGKLITREMDITNEGTNRTDFRYGAFGLLVSATTQIENSHTTCDITYHHHPLGELMTQKVSLEQPDKPPEENVIHYQYDAMKRLIGEQHEKVDNGKTQINKHLQYQYDVNNNLIQETIKKPEMEQGIRRHYNALDQLITVETSDENDKKSVIHDVNGRLICDAQGVQFEYDDNDFLLRATLASGSTLFYSYLPNGLLLKKFHQGQHTNFYYNPDSTVITVYKNYQWSSFISKGTDTIAAMTQDGVNQILSVHGSTGVKLDKNQIKINDYEGYGKREGLEPRDAVDDFSWNQEYNDQDAGLTYLRNRFYHLESKRFISSDAYPVANRYTYAKANPISYIDPMGNLANSKLNYIFGLISMLVGGVGIYYAIPTEGASLTLSAGAGLFSGIFTAMSGVSLAGSQGALDLGNKTIAKGLEYAFIATSSLAAAGFLVAIAPGVKNLVTLLAADTFMSEMGNVAEMQMSPLSRAISRISNFSNVSGISGISEEGSISLLPQYVAETAFTYDETNTIFPHFVSRSAGEHLMEKIAPYVRFGDRLSLARTSKAMKALIRPHLDTQVRLIREFKLAAEGAVRERQYMEVIRRFALHRYFTYDDIDFMTTQPNFFSNQKLDHYFSIFYTD